MSSHVSGVLTKWWPTLTADNDESCVVGLTKKQSDEWRAKRVKQPPWQTQQNLLTTAESSEWHITVSWGTWLSYNSNNGKLRMLMPCKGTSGVLQIMGSNAVIFAILESWLMSPLHCVLNWEVFLHCYRQTAVTYSVYTVWQYNPARNVHHKLQKNCSVST